MEETEPRGAIAREFAALALVALAAYGALSLACLDLGRQPNLGGPLGVQLAESLSVAFGYQSYVLMILVAALARRVWLATSAGAIVRAAVGGAVLILALSAAGGFWRFGEVPVGGAVGEMIAGLLGSYLNVGGGYIVVILALVGGIALMAGRAPTDLAASMAEATRLRGRTSTGSAEEIGLDEPRPATRLDAALTEARITPEAPLVKRSERPRPTAREKKAATKPRQKGGFRLPPLALLDVPPVEHSQVDESALERSARVLEQKLADFGVPGVVVEVQPGPVVTMYKLEPGSGVKVSQIVNLADDLSMALRAATVRILAPVPGEAVVGIEVPNRKREKIYLREILEAEEFSAAHSQLTIALGKDIAGHPAASDLATMPHLLIAGATGTGKSVSIHTMICFDSVQRDRRRRAFYPDRSEDARIVGLRGHTASAGAGCGRPGKGRRGAAMGDAGDGEPLSGDARPRRAQYRRLQSRDRRRRRTGRTQARNRCRKRRQERRLGRYAGQIPTSAEDRNRDRRIGRPLTERGQDRRARYNPSRAEGARRRYPSDSGHAAAFG